MIELIDDISRTGFIKVLLLKIVVFAKYLIGHI